MKCWPLKQTPKNNLTACGFTEMNQWDMKEGERLPFSWLAEQLNAAHCTHEATGQIRESLGFAVLFPVNAEYMLWFRSHCYQPFPPFLIPWARKPMFSHSLIRISYCCSGLTKSTRYSRKIFTSYFSRLKLRSTTITELQLLSHEEAKQHEVFSRCKKDTPDLNVSSGPGKDLSASLLEWMMWTVF